MKPVESGENKIKTILLIVISSPAMPKLRILSSLTRAESNIFPYLTKIGLLGVCHEPANGGTTWHTHPLHLGPDLL